MDSGVWRGRDARIRHKNSVPYLGSNNIPVTYPLETGVWGSPGIRGDFGGPVRVGSLPP
ncbi:hypothetical protein M1M38_gp112 [Halorubrum tailed virus 27]|uniref:Uncharacterized protein n=1 Tax=Halorubrum tailed virus 27 TaxID=2878008 RepID=A0AAE8XZ13_9CAUD|nr:hypothetical protein M1M38_gp112 [Halorubrum tailed virus 27]UBF22805.1 hypothetical protein HRTV-27_gp112 [Halorubrum tailed virus 27]